MPSQLCACGCGKIPVRGQYCRGHWLRLHRQEPRFSSLDEPPEEKPAARASFLDRPEGQLLVAVFSDAWEHRGECLRRQAGKFCAQCERDKTWAAATAATWLYAFESACEYLGLDADKARGVFLSRQHDGSLEAQNHAAELKLRAERRLGELLKGAVRAGNPQFSHDERIGKLPENVSHSQSHRWQTIADLPEEDFEWEIAERGPKPSRPSQGGLPGGRAPRRIRQNCHRHGPSCT